MSPARVEARAAPAATRMAPSGGLARLRAWRDQHAYSLVSSLGRFVQRPFATLLTVGVMAVAIALPLGLGLALANLQRLSGSLQESREIGVFLRVEVDAAQAERLATEIMQLFDALQAQGTAVLVASHDLALVRRMRKRVLVLDHGKLVDDISPEDLAA